MTTKISDTWLKKQPAPAKGAITIWDAEIKGFGVRIYAPTRRHPQGDRSFFLNYRIEGMERRFTIGNYPAWSSEAARAEAKLLRRRVDRGEDVAGDKRARRTAPTVADLAQRYRTEHLPLKAASSQLSDWHMIKKEILPVLGERKVASIDNVDIESLCRAITGRGKPIRANRVLAVMSKMFSLALKRLPDEDAAWRNQAQGNPCRGISKNPERSRTRFFS
uniref:tyrosine-type recombinase/integrase n=1 Tax=Roseiarcus sp. TaxID=1969460 RepID=UPI003F9646A4